MTKQQLENEFNDKMVVEISNVKNYIIKFENKIVKERLKFE